jgi:hypothetical protein
MRRIEPAYPDLLPLGFQLGSAPSAGGFDPVEMRLRPSAALRHDRPGDRSILRRPVRLVVHGPVAREQREHLERLVEGGHGVLLVLDGLLRPADVPAARFPGQLVAVARWALPPWGDAVETELEAWTCAGIPAGVLLGLGPCPGGLDLVESTVRSAREASATFVVAAPLVLPPEDRHRAYEATAGEAGDETLEDLFFHTDLGQLIADLEREATRACRRESLRETLPGPATSLVDADTFSAGAGLFLWARRLDLLDGVGSEGWQLRRAAHALLASGRNPLQLVADDNLRIVPGFTPWVEAFARALWSGGGAPYDEVLERWISH